MWGKIIIPMYRLWLHGLYGLYGPRCPLSLLKTVLSLICVHYRAGSLSLPALLRGSLRGIVHCNWCKYYNGFRCVNNGPSKPTWLGAISCNVSNRCFVVILLPLMWHVNAFFFNRARFELGSLPPQETGERFITLVELLKLVFVWLWICEWCVHDSGSVV